MLGNGLEQCKLLRAEEGGSGDVWGVKWTGLDFALLRVSHFWPFISMWFRTDNLQGWVTPHLFSKVTIKQKKATGTWLHAPSARNEGEDRGQTQQEQICASFGGKWMTFSLLMKHSLLNMLRAKMAPGSSCLTAVVSERSSPSSSICGDRSSLSQYLQVLEKVCKNRKLSVSTLEDLVAGENSLEFGNDLGNPRKWFSLDSYVLMIRSQSIPPSRHGKGAGIWVVAFILTLDTSGLVQTAGLGRKAGTISSGPFGHAEHTTLSLLPLPPSREPCATWWGSNIRVWRNHTES